MATNYEYDDEDDFDNVESSQEKKENPLRKVNKALEKRLKELEAENNTFKSQVRQRTVKDVLASKGINSKVAAFIPQDLEPTEEAINTWLTEYGDVFGAVKNDATPTESAAPRADLAANQRINNVVNSGQTPEISEDMLAKIMNAQDASALNDILGIQAI